ncbi:hypothetical protein L3X38_019481 [Prunus dulcis]|uniref:Uncharacterized protein n=1 Tax=Prunus dulcis TaxID=3755 RepID=A0AAD4ZB39_PRUDU|nr:hypothetical protein L3X38_019481 [Prunus dulcis]
MEVEETQAQGWGGGGRKKNSFQRGAQARVGCGTHQLGLARGPVQPAFETEFPRIGSGSSRKATNPATDDEDQDPSCLDLKRAATPASSASRGPPAAKIGTTRCGLQRGSETRGYGCQSHSPALPPAETHPPTPFPREIHP